MQFPLNSLLTMDDISQSLSQELSPPDAVLLQKRLAGLVKLVPCSPESVRVVCGCDVSYRGGKRSTIATAAVVNWDCEKREIMETATTIGECHFPYIPGLLSFREIPPLLTALQMLTVRPDVLLIDGQGIAHPRRFGLACHIGLLLDIPSIGCAKSRLIGDYDEPLAERGQTSPLLSNTELIGIVFRSRKAVKPLFVSPGHRTDVVSCHHIVEKTLGSFRIPEPLRIAHHLTRNSFHTGHETECLLFRKE